MSRLQFQIVKIKCSSCGREQAQRFEPGQRVTAKDVADAADFFKAIGWLMADRAGIGWTCPFCRKPS